MESTLHKILEAFGISSSKERVVREPFLSNITDFYPKRSKSEGERLVGTNATILPSTREESYSEVHLEKLPVASKTERATKKDCQGDGGHKMDVAEANENRQSAAVRTRKYGVFGKFYPRSFSLETDVSAKRSSEDNGTRKDNSSLSERLPTRSSSLDIEVGKSSLQDDCSDISLATESEEVSGNSDSTYVSKNSSYEFRNSKHSVYISGNHYSAGGSSEVNRINKSNYDDYYDVKVDGFNHNDGTAKRQGFSHINKQRNKNGLRPRLNSTETQAGKSAYNGAKEYCAFEDRGSKHSCRKTDVILARDYGGFTLEKKRSRSEEVHIEAGRASSIIWKNTSKQKETANTEFTGKRDDHQIKLATFRSERMENSHNWQPKPESIDITGYERWIAASNRYNDASSVEFEDGVESLTADERQLFSQNDIKLQDNGIFKSIQQSQKNKEFAEFSHGDGSISKNINENAAAPFKAEYFGGEGSAKQNHQHRISHMADIGSSWDDVDAEKSFIKETQRNSQNVPKIDICQISTSSAEEESTDNAPKAKISDHILEPNANRRNTGLQRGYSENYYIDEDICTDDLHIVDTSMCSSSYPGGRDYYLLQDNSSRRPMKLRRDSPFAFPLIEEFARNFKHPMHAKKTHGVSYSQNGRLSAQGSSIQEGERSRAISPRSTAISINRKERL